MNLHRLLLRARRRGRRPIRVAADRRRQVRLDVPAPGAAHAGDARGRHRRPVRARARGPRWRASAGRRRSRRPDAGRGASPRRHLADRGRDGADRRSAHRGGGGMHRRSRRRPAPCAAPPSRHGKHVVMVNVEADVLAGPLLAREAAARRRGLFHGLWRPARAGLRDGGHAPRRRLHRRRRGQGHEVPAALPRQHAGDGLGLLRPDARSRRGGRDEPADVQLLPRRHEVGDRDGGDRQCHRPGAARGRAGLPALRHVATARPAAPAQRGRRAAAQGHGGGGLLRSTRDGARDPGQPALGRLCRCSRARPTTPAAASPNTASRPITSGRYAALWRPYHFIGLELGVSVASAALRREPTGCAEAWSGDVRRGGQARPAAPARCWTARAARRSGASASRPRGRARWARCRSASRMAWRWRATSRQGALLTEADLRAAPAPSEALAMRAACSRLVRPHGDACRQSRSTRPDGHGRRSGRIAMRSAFRLLIVAILLFGGAWPITKAALADATPMWFGGRAARACGAGRGAAAGRARAAAPAAAARLARGVRLGLFQLGGFFVLAHAAVALVPAGRTAIVQRRRPIG